MKIFVISAKKILLWSFVLLLTALFILMSNTGIKVIEAFNGKRDLPIYAVETNNSDIALTFDCAWGAEDIPGILETLKSENVKATFFIVGQWAVKNSDMVKLIYEHGHDIGNHSYSHLRMGAIDKERIRSEIEKCNEKLSEITGAKVDLFRPPYGDYNNLVVSTARELGCYTIQWNADSLDWKPDITREAIINRIIRYTKPGSILLFHNDTKYTAEILPEIIKTLKSKGFNFVPVSELIYRENYYIDFDGTQKKKSG